MSMVALPLTSTSVDRASLRTNIGNLEDAGTLRPLQQEILDTLGAESTAILYLDPRRPLTREQLLAHKLWQQALAGDRDSQKLVLAYLYGRPRERVDISASVTSTLTVESFREQLQALTVPSTAVNARSDKQQADPESSSQASALAMRASSPQTFAPDDQPDEYQDAF